MLQTQIVEVNLGQGIDSKTDEKAVVETKLITLENATFEKLGTLKKRNGYTANDVLVGTSESPVSIGALNDSTFVTSDNALFSVIGSSASKVGNVSSFRTDVKTTPTSSMTANNFSPTNAAMSRIHAQKFQGYMLYLYLYLSPPSTSVLRLTITDYSTGSYIKDIDIVSFASNGLNNESYQLVVSGNYAYVLYKNTSTSSVYSLNIDLVTSTNSGINGIPYGIATSSNNIEVATSSGQYYTVASGVVTYVGQYTDQSFVSVSLAKDLSGRVYLLGIKTDYNASVVYGHTNGNPYTTINISVKGYSHITGVGYTNSSILVFTDFGNKQDFTNQYINMSECVWNAAHDAKGVILYGACIASDAIRYTDAAGNVRLFLAAYCDPYKYETALIGLQNVIGSTTFYPVFKSLEGQCYSRSNDYANTNIFTLPSVSVDGNKLLIPTQVAIATESKSGVIVPTELAGKLIIAQESSVDGLSNIQFGKTDLIASAFPVVYDGKSVFEHGFIRRPKLQVTEPTFSLRNTLPAGTYRLQAIYSYVDATGQLHRSAPSDIVTYVSTGSAGKATDVDIECCNPTIRSNYTVELYRTTVGGSVLYKCLTLNVNTVTTVIGTDDLLTAGGTDAEIVDNAVIYTSGDIIASDPLPACVGFNTYRNRLVTIDTESDVVQYSKKRQELIGAEFSSLFTIEVDPVGGRLTAAIEMDSNLVIFRQSAIYVTNGDGPNDAGGNNDIREPQRVSSDVGCDDGCGGRSVVLTPKGVMFKSAKGIYLIDRGLNVTYIGAEVERYNSYLMTSAIALASKNQVRFQHSNGDTLVYDYVVGQWSTFTNHSGLFAKVVGGVYNYIRTNGSIWSESTGFADGAYAIVMKLKTAWIKLNSMQQFKRIRRVTVLGNYIGAHTATLRTYTDYKSTVNETHVFNAAAIVPAEDNVYQWDNHMKVQKCESLQVEIYDTPTTANEAYSINNIAFEVALKTGINKMKETRRI
jgi:hypothetical protein